MKYNQITDILRNFYNIRIISNEKRVNNNIYSFSYKSENYLFKWHNHKTLNNVDKINKVYKEVNKNKLIPYMMETVSGNLLETNKNNIFSIQKELIGDSPNPYDISILALYLAKLHSCMNKINTGKITNHFEEKIGNIEKKIQEYGYNDVLNIIIDTEEYIKNNKKQIVHGDLHKSNLLISNEKIYFLDFDTAHHSLVETDVAMISYRVCGTDKSLIVKFIDKYNRYSKKRLKFDTVIKFLVRLILQRILFIQICINNGINDWIWDLNNQKKYLKDAMKIIK